ncbi:chaplin [Streptomyces sp. NPDC057638]|uniref:chaplin n=1 Tax=Streptomyces sp. NPDC057638 TaxID=3346190 RepID=UPI003676C821
MRQVTRKGLITMAAAGGAIALGGTYAQADAGAHGGASHSPGVLSGNSVQVPVSVPVNACGNSVNAAGLLNPTFGNRCVTESGGAAHAGTLPGHSGPVGSPGAPAAVPVTGGGAQASGVAANSPGVGSGNQVQAPVDVPVNACGNSADVVGLLNPAFGNGCARESVPPTVHTPAPPPPHVPGKNVPQPPVDKRVPTPRPPAAVAEPPAPAPAPADQPAELASTGMDGLGLVLPAGAGMLLAGAVLYRRSRSAA